MVEANAFHIFLLLGFFFFLLSSIFYHVCRFLWKRAREKWRERLKSNGRIVSETRSNGTTIQRIVPRFTHRNTSPIHKTLISIFRSNVFVKNSPLCRFTDILFYRWIFDNKIWLIFFLQQCNYILVWKFVILFFFSLRFCFFFLSRILFIIYRKRLLILLEENIHWCSRFVQFSTCNFCLSMYIVDTENW